VQNNRQHQASVFFAIRCQTADRNTWYSEPAAAGISRGHCKMSASVQFWFLNVGPQNLLVENETTAVTSANCTPVSEMFLQFPNAAQNSTYSFGNQKLHYLPLTAGHTRTKPSNRLTNYRNHSSVWAKNIISKSTKS